MRGHRVGSVLAVFLVAVLVATALGSIVQTQFNIAALTGLGLDVPARQRVAMTLHDLGMFTPVYGTIVVAAFAIALPLAAFLARSRPRWRPLWFLLAGAAGVLVGFVVVNALLPMPTFIAATRTMGGLAALMATAAIGAWLFGHLHARA